MTKSTNFTLLFAIYKSPNCQNRNLRGSPVADPKNIFFAYEEFFRFSLVSLRILLHIETAKKSL
jgi:hypothetical protein